MIAIPSSDLQPSLFPEDQPVVERFELRPYQAQVIDGIIKALMEGQKRILAVVATGGGKTVIASELIDRAVKKGNQVMFCVHLDCLVGQTYEKLKGWGLGDQCGFIKAGWPENRGAPIQIASLQTLSRRKWWRDILRPAVVILDEAHISAFSKVGGLLFETFPGSVHVGFTATPFRMSRRQGMGDHYEHLVLGPLPSELMEQDYLAPGRYFTLSQADLDGVATKGGDFAKDQLGVVCDKPELISRVVDEWCAKAPGLRTLAFCVNVSHARNVAAEFNRRGIRSGCVDGETPIEERNQMYKALREKRILVLTSCNVISIGFDEPSAEVGLMLRPTKSYSLHLQQVGRLLRISPKTGKTEALILDQAGNLSRLGRAEDLTEAMISLRAGSKGNDGEAPNLKVCPTSRTDDQGRQGCGHVMLCFRQTCPECGYSFDQEAFISQSADLEEYIPEVNPLQRNFYVGLIQQCYSQGWSPGAAAMRFKERYYKGPSIGITRNALFGPGPTRENVLHYYSHLVGIADAKSKKLSWVKQSMTKEFGAAWGSVIPDPEGTARLASNGRQTALQMGR